MDQKRIGAFIGELRKEKKLSQADLGDRLGVTNKTVSRWENGNYMPDISLMQELCRELEIDINELLSGERLTDQDFRMQAEANLLSSLKQQRSLGREKAVSDFLGGAGTGLLVSAFYSPDSMRKTVVAIIAIAMIFGGWYCRSRYDKHLTGQQPPEK